MHSANDMTTNMILHLNDRNKAAAIAEYSSWHYTDPEVS